MSIRKFVGRFGMAAGLAAAVALGLSVQAVGAPVISTASTAGTPTVSLSPECLAALQSIRSAWIADRQQDGEEGSAADPSQDAAERAQIQNLIAAARSACAAEKAAARPSTAATVPVEPAVPAQCKTAAQAWVADARSLWTAGKAPTPAQQAQLRQLGQAVRSACGWPTGEWPPRA